MLTVETIRKIRLAIHRNGGGIAGMATGIESSPLDHGCFISGHWRSLSRRLFKCLRWLSRALRSHSGLCTDTSTVPC